MADNVTILDSAEVEKTVATQDIGSGVHASKVVLVNSGGEAITQDKGSDVATGLISGETIMSAMGERETMAVVVSGEDVWRGNELSPAPTSTTSIPTPSSSGEQMTVVSESNNDTGAGTGVRTIKIHYLDAVGDEQTETITMNGTTPVNTVATDIRFVNDMYTTSVGSGGVAADHIKIYKTGSTGLVYNMIAQGGNKSLVPNRMVPNGKTLVIKNWHASEAQGKRVTFRLRSTDMYGELIEGVFCFKDTVYLNKSNSGGLRENIVIPQLSIVKVSAWSDQAAAEGSVSWWGYLSTN